MAEEERRLSEHDFQRVCKLLGRFSRYTQQFEKEDVERKSCLANLAGAEIEKEQEKHD